MKKLISALLAVLLLAAPVLAADEPDTLAARFDALRAEYHLDETNFAVSYYNTVTGEIARSSSLIASLSPCSTASAISGRIRRRCAAISR